MTDRASAGPQPDGTEGGKIPANAGDVPIGGIIPYSGALASIPTNWKLCDGTGGTVNLVDRFILGTVTALEIGTVGGTAQHKHAVGTLVNDSVSAGTPAGTVSQPSLTMNSYTPAGTVSAPTFTGNAVAAASTNVTPDLVAADTSGAGVSPVTTATGTVSAPTFSGTPATLTGTVSQPTFSGAALAGHTHTISGKTAIAEDLSASTADVRPPWLKLAFIQRMS